MASTYSWGTEQPGPGDWPPGGYAAPSPWAARPAPGYPPPGYPDAPQTGASFGHGQVLPPGVYFDEASGLVLPLGVELATVGRRIGAWFLAFPLAIVTLGVGYMVWGLVVWGRGQTPALQVLGMRCWCPQAGQVARWRHMALREVIGGLADNLLNWVTLLTSFALMLLTRDRKCLHDLVAGTVVLRDPGRVLAAY